MALTDEDVTHFGGEFTQSVMAESVEGNSIDLDEW